MTNQAVLTFNMSFSRQEHLENYVQAIKKKILKIKGIRTAMGARGSNPQGCLQLLEAAPARARGARRGLLLRWLCLPPLLLASAVLNLVVNILRAP